MEEEEDLKLKSGDSAIVIRHNGDKAGGFIVQIYHNMDKKQVSLSDIAFYALLTRGMAYHVTTDLASVLEYGRQSFEESEELITIH
jgi:hypothetical protein